MIEFQIIYKLKECIFRCVRKTAIKVLPKEFRQKLKERFKIKMRVGLLEEMV